MDKLSKVKGIGPKTELLLNKIGIYEIDDLVTHYPFRYDVLRRTDLKSVTDPEQKIVVDGKVESIPLVIRFRGGANKLNFRLSTPNGMVGVSIFGRAFLKQSLPIGEKIIVIGKYDASKNIINASDIKFGVLTNQDKIESVYHSTSGLSQKILINAINNALMTYGNTINDNIPKYLLDKYNFLNKKTALNIVHNPPNYDKLKEASMRLKYEELFEFMFKINYLRESNKKNNAGVERKTDKSIDDFVKKLPFELTNDQKAALDEIIKDLSSSTRMNRLLQGDVGSGKTIVAILAMYYNYLCGYQSALMAPTEILAVQHYNNMKELFKDTNVAVELLTGSITKKDKMPIYNDLKNGTINIIVGTHALIQEEVEYHNLGLVVTDEQHRFGVNQRSNLKNKGVKPDVLYMSATPIPRTYALTIYGDMDVSIIKEMPKGRLPVKTKVFSNKEMKEVYKLMEEELQNKHQIYVIAPLIEENEELDLTNVYTLRDKMNLIFGNKYKIDIVHGKMKAKEKDLIMGEFKQNVVNILISTTVIEVGVDVSNATMMVIFDANRFGLSTLHQLRGRVGRSSLQSKCLLISDNEDAKRLQIMETCNDGFVISEEDFKLRGSGDLFGTKQSGDMTFKIANLRIDYKILVQAKNDSKEYLLNHDYDKDELKIRLINSIKSD
ncbi:MAG: ATP-dependent DNA helicase RecG [Bacilli bacterium]|nr:ATP-dependent DNA helicase RecG [Bacilli bacterium]